MQQTIEVSPVIAAPISYTYPDQDFWVEYSELWENSLHRPVFKSPHYIQYLADRYRKDFAVYRFVIDGKLKGVIFFRKTRTEYRLLTDVKADHNFFVIHKSCTNEQIEEFFTRFLAAVNKENWSLVLRVQPLWASYMTIFVKAVNASGMFWNVAKRSVCPVLEEATAKELYDKLNSSRELRYRVSRIKSQLNGEFEILTGDEDMENWVKQFCALHRKRWDGTESPSRYKNDDEEKFLRDCLLSWAHDRVLVRFAVKVKGERIGFVICLIQQNSLIHHSTAYEDEYYKYSPGKALILVIAEWMKNHNLNILDFGEGAESYKYAYTNKEMELNEISVSSIANLSFIFKVKLRQVFSEKVSDNPGLKRFYKEKIKPLTQRAKF